MVWIWVRKLTGIVKCFDDNIAAWLKELECVARNCLLIPHMLKDVREVDDVKRGARSIELFCGRANPGKTVIGGVLTREVEGFRFGVDADYCANVFVRRELQYSIKSVEASHIQDSGIFNGFEADCFECFVVRCGAFYCNFVDFASAPTH